VRQGRGERAVRLPPVLQWHAAQYNIAASAVSECITMNFNAPLSVTMYPSKPHSLRSTSAIKGDMHEGYPFTPL
jgi:hypothetical protein